TASYDTANDLKIFTPSNFVFGRGKVDGRPVVVGGDDFTVRGGSADATIKEKHLQCEDMAYELRLPLLRLVEGSGGGGSVKTIETTGRANVPALAGWDSGVRNIGTIPRVALGLGSVAGLGAAPRAAARPARGRARARGRLADERDSARRAQAVQDAPDPRGRRRHGLAVRDRTALRPLDHHRARAARWLARRAHGERSVLLRRRVGG